jgi:hypothetical protein
MNALRRQPRLVALLLLAVFLLGSDRAHALVPPTNTINELEGQNQNSSTSGTTGTSPEGGDQTKSHDGTSNDGTTQGGQHAPEPASFVTGLVGAGVLGLAALRRRLRQSQAEE